MTERTHVTTFRANPVQQGFIQSRATADLFSSRRGEGKSVGLCWSTLYHTRHNPGANWAIGRDTFENLQKTTMKTFFEHFPNGVYGNYHQTKKEWTWAEGVAKGTVTFVGLDDPSDASKFLSWELAGICLDEPAPAVTSGGIDELIFDIGMTCLRQPGMQWYGMKLAENNPDESHWTYKKFVSPGTPGYKLWQPATPENIGNLPDGYYENMRAALAHRPDLQRRFVDGMFGFQQEGRPVTPQWDDNHHLYLGLRPIPKYPVHCLWDWGHNPTCIVTQRTPMGEWLILDALVGEGIGAEELIVDAVRPLLADRYKNSELHHIGDPSGETGDQSSILRSPVGTLKKCLGGSWRRGPIKLIHRIEPLQAVLARKGIVRVDRERASAVWHALRGGWHYHVARTGLVSTEPRKNIHSHPGDAMGYGAAILYPMGKLVMAQKKDQIEPTRATYSFGSGGGVRFPAKPPHGTVIGAS